jgi:hypothetical protein
MAFGIGLEGELIEVICSKDEAVTCDLDAYQEYLKTLDETILGLKPEIQPTRFCLKRTLPYAAAQRVRNQQLGYKDGDVEVRLGFILEEVRASLIDIKNPGAGLEYKKDGDGGASKTLVEKLDAYGIVQELYTARQSSMKSNPGVSKKS